MSTTESVFERKLREKLAAKGQTLPVPSSKPSSQPVAGATPAASIDHSANVPTDEDLGITRDPQEDELDRQIQGINVVEAYMRWCKKMVPRVGAGQTESIKVSCPNPQHPDKNPSAWLNLDKGVFHCAACNMGGDLWDMAAWHHGFPVPGYKQDKEMFRELRGKIGADLGFSPMRTVTGQTVMVKPQPYQPEPEDQPEEKKENSAPVGKLPAAAAEEIDDEDHQLNKQAPTIDWRKLLDSDTFLRRYMEATTKDTCPEEFHFWNGLVALGFAVGRDVVLRDVEMVVGNLFVCLTGPSSAGKSRSKRHLTRLLREVLPYDNNMPISRGTKQVKSPGSAEYLVYTFQSEEEDPTNPKNKIRYPVRAMVDFDELATLMSTANRVGNNIRPQLMELYDSPEVLESGSLTGGLRHAIMPFGSCVATTQNKSMRNLLDSRDDGSGFLNRWVFAQGQLKPRVSIGGAIIDTGEAAMMLRQIHQWSFTSKKLDLSPDAYKRWDEFFHSVVVPSQDTASKAGTEVLARLDLLMKKLFLLFAVDKFEEEVSLKSVEQAIELWPYLVRTFGVVNKEMKKTETSDLQDDVIRLIKKMTAANGEPPSKKMLYDAIKRKLTSAKQLADLLATLVKLGLIEEDKIQGKVGRPKQVYKVVNS